MIRMIDIDDTIGASRLPPKALVELLTTAPVFCFSSVVINIFPKKLLSYWK